tara:strand:- start:966 stop:1487 length:522 start_codon:yes stop_codon:yes gene_type:complete
MDTCDTYTIKDRLRHLIEPLPPDQAESAIKDIMEFVRRLRKQNDKKLEREADQRRRKAAVTDLNRTLCAYIASGASESDIFRTVSRHWRQKPSEVTKIYRIHADRIRRECRNVEIWRRIAINDENVTDLAKEYRLSRSQVHRIYKKMCENHPAQAYEAQILALLASIDSPQRA